MITLFFIDYKNLFTVIVFGFRCHDKCFYGIK